MKSNDVFKPNGIPSVTYVDRREINIEEALKDALGVDNIVISVSGPSKSGKTVLVNRVIESDNLITISGAAIKSADQIWSNVLAWMETPVAKSQTTGLTTGGALSLDGGGKIGLPLIAESSARASVEASASKGFTATSLHLDNHFAQVVKEIGESDYVVFIDDFHYIPKEAQIEAGRQIKSIAEQGVKVCTASVPHRSDDVVRSNPELRGRIAAIDSTPWSEAELRQIAEKGFSRLNVIPDEKEISRLISESLGSPQLMQLLCLNY